MLYADDLEWIGDGVNFKGIDSHLADARRAGTATFKGYDEGEVTHIQQIAKMVKLPNTRGFGEDVFFSKPACFRCTRYIFRTHLRQMIQTNPHSSRHLLPSAAKRRPSTSEEFNQIMNSLEETSNLA